MGQIKKSKSICYINPFVFWFVWEQENLLSKLTDLYYAYNPIFFYCLSFPPYFYHFLRGERVAELSWKIMNFRLQKHQLQMRWNHFRVIGPFWSNITLVFWWSQMSCKTLGWNYLRFIKKHEILNLVKISKKMSTKLPSPFPLVRKTLLIDCLLVWPRLWSFKTVS